MGKAASQALKSLLVDSLSFSLAREGDSLAAIFLAHDEQVIDETRDTHRFSLEPIPLAAPAWWRAARAPLPEQQLGLSVALRRGHARSRCALR